MTENTIKRRKKEYLKLTWF